jgi:ribosomal protein S18 acetylase RimI-like enzyme
VTPSVERIERSGFAAWSPDETTEINGWTVASSGGFTRRLNSATTQGSADTSPATHQAVTSWLADRGAELTVRITPLVENQTATSCADTWGLTSVDETLVLVREVEASEESAGVRVVAASDSQYTAELFELNGRDPTVLASWERIIKRIGDRAAGLWIPGAAVGFVAVSDHIGSVFSVAVGPDQQRKGLATQVMAAANAWAVDNGAASMFLQVVGTNDGAQALYKRLGFVEQYRYHYLQP